MKKQFHEYHRPSEGEFQKLWDNCIFALDANVLLNIYGYSEQTREEFLALLERLSARLRIPHQFALEYHRNRAYAIMQQVKNYSKVERVLENLYTEELLPKNKHPFLGERMMKAFNSIRQTLAKSRKAHEKLFANDHYFDRITGIFQIVGNPSVDWEKMCEIGRRRYATKKPPGYADLKDKGEPDAFGDFIGWMQLIEFSRTEQKPAILITDDAKEDWWQIQGDRTIGPRPELIAEFRAECNQSFYMYSSGQFLTFANTYLKERVKRGAIKEVEERMREQLQTASNKKTVMAPPPVSMVPEKTFVIPEQPKAENIKTVTRLDDPPKDNPPKGNQ